MYCFVFYLKLKLFCPMQSINHGGKLVNLRDTSPRAGVKNNCTLRVCIGRICFSSGGRDMIRSNLSTRSMYEPENFNFFQFANKTFEKNN